MHCAEPCGACLFQLSHLQYPSLFVYGWLNGYSSWTDCQLSPSSLHIAKNDDFPSIFRRIYDLIPEICWPRKIGQPRDISEISVWVPNWIDILMFVSMQTLVEQCCNVTKQWTHYSWCVTEYMYNQALWQNIIVLHLLVTHKHRILFGCWA